MPTISLKKISKEAYDYILKIQAEKKRKKCVGVYSQETTVLEIIKEHKELTEKKETMSLLESVIEKINDSFYADISAIKSNHEKHKERVERAIKWFDENRIPENNNDSKKDSLFVGTKVKYNEVECMITRHDFKGIPYFNAYFELRPMRSIDNIGNMAGGMKRVEF